MHRSNNSHIKILGSSLLLCCYDWQIHTSWIYKLKRTVRLTGPILFVNEGLFSSR